MSQPARSNSTTYVGTGRRPGRVKLPDHLKKHRQHGTRARYMYGEVGQDTKNGCRCHECGAAAWNYELKRRIAKKRGQEFFVDATETREHLLWLSSAGIGSRTVAERSGVDRSTILAIKRCETNKVRPETADKLLAINLTHAHPRSRIVAKRALELVAECKEHGIPERRIAQLLGLAAGSLQIRKSGRMTPERAARIEAACLELLAPIHAQRDWDARRQRDYRQRMAMEDG